MASCTQMAIGGLVYIKTPIKNFIAITPDSFFVQSYCSIFSTVLQESIYNWFCSIGQKIKWGSNNKSFACGLKAFMTFRCGGLCAGPSGAEKFFQNLEEKFFKVHGFFFGKNFFEIACGLLNYFPGLRLLK